MLSTTTSYAVRALSCLAKTGDNNAILGRELAEMAEVPANYLSKILLVLKRAGFVEATRGTGGGYRLDRSPQDISLMQIAELFDPQGALHGCLFDASKPCSEDHLCPAHEGWYEVKRVYREFLETTTLAALVEAGPAREEVGDDRPSQ